MRKAIHLHSVNDGVALALISGQRATRIYLSAEEALQLAYRLQAHAKGQAPMEMVIDKKDD